MNAIPTKNVNIMHGWIEWPKREAWHNIKKRRKRPFGVASGTTRMWRNNRRPQEQDLIEDEEIMEEYCNFSLTVC
jgi:hypothetical protein